MNFEYRVETVTFDKTTERAGALVELANRLGRNGWRLVPYSVAPRLAMNEHQLEVMFERASS